MNPWKETAAFDPMFCDAVTITHGGVSGTFCACVFPPERVDPFSEVDAESGLLKISFVMRTTGEGAWNRAEPPQIGDAMQTVDGKKWSLTDVVYFDDSYTIEARSVD